MALKSGGLSHRHETTMQYVLNRAGEPGTLTTSALLLHYYVVESWIPI